MNRLALLVAAVVLVGCGKKKPQEGIEPPPVAPPTTGSAAPAPKPLTAEEVAKHFDDCWGMWNAAKYDDFKGGCFTADATRDVPGSGLPIASGAAAVVDSTKLLKSGLPDLKGEPALELVDGHNLAAVVLVTGTQSAALKTPMGEIPATNKKVGFLVAQVIDFDDTGHAKTEADYFDLATLVGQLNPNPKQPVRAAMDKAPMAKQVIVAKHDDTEKANLETVKQALEALNKHDLKAFGALLADDLVDSDQSVSKDAKKAELLATLAATAKGMPDFKITATATWAAGAYVVVTALQTGTTATKKTINIPAVNIIELDKGKLKTVMGFSQSLAMATQLGTPPAK
jgi:steroid delta-isomerase-like uncharacterized protein